MPDELTQLRSAIAAIHDHLHAGRINDAHEACECAVNGEAVHQPNLTLSQSATAQVFGSRFNELCKSLGVQAAFVALMPSATVPGAVSIQIGGEVGTCQIVEDAFRKRSYYQGRHPC